jgi:hypothetical protein
MYTHLRLNVYRIVNQSLQIYIGTKKEHRTVKVILLTDFPFCLSRRITHAIT